MGVKREILSLPYCIDTDTFQPDNRKKHDNLLLFVGRIDKIKGLHVLLESLLYLSPHKEIVIIGPIGDSNYFRKIMSMCHKINNTHNHTIRYIESVKHNDLVQWYQRATVLVRPDLLKVSGGFTAIEALACGTPVIGTGNDVVKHGIDGVIVSPNSPKELANAIQTLLENRELREKYGKEGRRIIEHRFDWKTCTGELIKIYEHLLNRYK
jgi:glycosyltransferase involved in cell wall biosynthesis